MDGEDLETLRAVAISGDGTKGRSDRSRIAEHIELHVTGAAYSCCGKGWRRKDHPAIYRGYVDNLGENSLMLYSTGIGTLSYVCAVRFDEVSEVVPLNRSY